MSCHSLGPFLVPGPLRRPGVYSVTLPPTARKVKHVSESHSLELFRPSAPDTQDERGPSGNGRRATGARDRLTLASRPQTCSSVPSVRVPASAARNRTERAAKAQRFASAEMRKFPPHNYHLQANSLSSRTVPPSPSGAIFRLNE